MDSHALILRKGLHQLKLSHILNLEENLLHYFILLKNWNKVYNLTGIRKSEDIITKNLLDSLSIHSYLTGTFILDLGTGAGLPGIPLALSNPHQKFYLIDSNRKKMIFLEHVKQKLLLDNIILCNQRIEDLQPPPQFDNIVSRAFASLKDMILSSQHLLKPQGKFLAMKGVYPSEEIYNIPSSYRICYVTPLSVPGLPAKRHLIGIEAK